MNERQTHGSRTMNIMKIRILMIALLLMGMVALPQVATGQDVNLRETPTVKVVKRVRDAVVNINTTQTVRQPFGPFGNDPFFRRFYRGPMIERERTSLGSGFILHADGYIVTNAHVVTSADEVEVKLNNGSILPARVLAADAEHDLAVLRVDVPEGVKLQPVELGDSSDLMPGEPVIAIGNPLGYEHSVTTGIISATNRPLRVSRRLELTDLIQTDTPINPGNSGGPLLNAYGQVIGINSAIRGDAQNIGFAIPVNRMRELITELLSPLAVNRVDLGGQVIEHRTLLPPSTVKVTLKWQSSDKTQAPVPFDRIDGHPVANIVEAYVKLLSCSPGKTVTLSQGASKVELVAKVPPISNAQRLAQDILGLTPRELTAADRARLKLATAKGVLIGSVDRGGPAQQAGLRKGDLIVQLGRYRIADMSDLAVLLGVIRRDAVGDIYVMRNGRLGRVRIKINAPSPSRGPV